ncbi:MAG: AraC family transcriptional regulator [Frankiales bacterium]|nr:AraC family transcriptional regulator [Frankiales bacterium]
MADYPPGSSFGPRLLGDYEFVWLLAGSAVWSVSEPTSDTEPRELRLTQGVLALARSGTIDSYRWDEAQPSRHAYVHFSLIASADLPSETSWPPVRSLAANPLLRGICGYLVSLAGQDSSLARARSDALVGLLLEAFVRDPQIDGTVVLTPQVAAVVQHVRDRWSRDGIRALDAGELAAAASISPGHLFRVFRQQYACGPARALEQVRLARAAVQLQRSNATIAEVSRLSGFANPYHFSRRFSAVYGTPPGAYRRLTPGPDPLEPVRVGGLLPLAHALLGYPE